ncbi:MAG: TetR/AcrR family transcriptional regulator [Erysipelotrichaceae bacterium]|nr:TetR/AcrR family transcriptional regulator [Erysipelotrichaceae bacterium]
MNNSTRTARTSAAIKQEVLKQMMTRKYNELSVTDICDALDLSRRTFYVHFYSIDDVFAKLFDDINEPLYKGFDALKEKRKHMKEDDQRFMLDEIFQLINNTISAHTGYLRRIAEEPSYSGIQAKHIALMKNMISEYLDPGRSASNIWQIYLDYYTSGILELYFQWYRGTSSMSLDEIRQFADRIMHTDMKYFIVPSEQK